jgi:hypothetical protein
MISMKAGATPVAAAVAAHRRRSAERQNKAMQRKRNDFNEAIG